jgi:hypothetical protein
VFDYVAGALRLLFSGRSRFARGKTTLTDYEQVTTGFVAGAPSAARTRPMEVSRRLTAQAVRWFSVNMSGFFAECSR